MRMHAIVKMNALWIAALMGYLLYNNNNTTSIAEVTTRPVVVPSTVPAAPRPNRTVRCELATLGGLLVTDSDGYVCERFSVDGDTGCCSVDRERDLHACVSCLHFSDQPCDTDFCCEYYEHCVSCCMSKFDIAKCAHECRTSSKTLNESGAYARPSHRYCHVDTPPTSSTTKIPTPSPAPQYDKDGNPIEWLSL